MNYFLNIKGFIKIIKQIYLRTEKFRIKTLKSSTTCLCKELEQLV